MLMVLLVEPSSFKLVGALGGRSITSIGSVGIIISSMKSVELAAEALAREIRA